MKTLEERYSPEHVAAIKNHDLYLALLADRRATLEAPYGNDDATSGNR